MIFSLALASTVRASTEDGAPVDAPPASGTEEETCGAHGQVTLIGQAYPSSHSSTAGARTFGDDAGAISSFSASLFLGLRVASGLELYVGPETEGRSFEATPHGLGAYPNLDLFQTSDPKRLVAIPPLFARATVALGGETSKLVSGPFQLAGKQASRRLQLVAGIFSLHDLLARSTTAGDPQETFLNAGIARAGAFDAPAIDVGHSAGVGLELVVDDFALRASALLMPDTVHGVGFDTNVTRAHGFAAEAQFVYGHGAAGGVVRWLAFENVGSLGSYAEAVADAGPAGTPTAVSATRRYGRTKVGFVTALDQRIDGPVHAFFHASANDGRTEALSFLDVDRALALGLTAAGTPWGRAVDLAGVAAVTSDVSSEHRLFLARGGAGPIVGNDGPHVDAEWALEVFYRYALSEWIALSGDYQILFDPGYDHQRGPLHLFGVRARATF